MDIKTVKYQGKLDRDNLRAELLARMPDVVQYLLPNGKRRGRQYIVGDVEGTTGESLVIELEGERAGLWKDFATDEGGDIFDLWASVIRIDTKNDFPRVIRTVAEWLGFHEACEPALPVTPIKSLQVQQSEAQAIDKQLGKPSFEWKYFARTFKEGVLAVVRRYDFADGTKTYRPWDPKQQRCVAPAIRPLYNLQYYHEGDTIILVEGEKCADVVSDEGLVGTTAMNGANAPIDKTDWLPLKSKHVIIWPDNDEAGMKYAQRAAKAVSDAGAKSVSMLQIPADKPSKWDAADAKAEGLVIEKFIRDHQLPWHTDIIEQSTVKTTASQVTSQSKLMFNFKKASDHYYNNAPMPEDIIGPRVLTRRGMLVLGGEAKVGKSDFLLSWMLHMAGGIEFLDMKPSQPLRVVYIQAELQEDFLRERIQSIILPESVRDTALNNLIVTPQLRLVLDEKTVEQAIQEVRGMIDGSEVDVIVIDPIRNVFDSGDDNLGENDNNAMLVFLRDRVEQLRDELNLNAGIILAHHTKKITKRQLEEGPFLALSGASSLRTYYTTGMILYRPDETRKNVRQLMFELRNGPSIADKLIDKVDGVWQELAYNEYRLVRQETSRKFDQERDRKHDVILQLIADEAKQGRVYTANQFAEHFEGQLGLGSSRTISRRLSVQATKGHIKFFQDARDYGLDVSKQCGLNGYLCVKGMQVPDGEVVSKDTGEVARCYKTVLPTHYKSPGQGVLLAVENRQVWVTQEMKSSGKISADD